VQSSCKVYVEWLARGAHGCRPDQTAMGALPLDPGGELVSRRPPLLSLACNKLVGTPLCMWHSGTYEMNYVLYVKGVMLICRVCVFCTCECVLKIDIFPRPFATGLGTGFGGLKNVCLFEVWCS